ncbi:MAG: DUF6249 domain-containing protein [Vicinamibacterales bacterium]
MEFLATALAFMMGLVSLIGGVIIIVVAFHQRTRRIEMLYRERMAMIERGLAPAPESAAGGWGGDHPPAPSTRIGIVIVALGIGLILLIGFAAGEPGAAVGVGGAVVTLGAAFIVNGELQRRSRLPASTSSQDSAPRPPIGPSDPPGPAGA